MEQIGYGALFLVEIAHISVGGIVYPCHPFDICGGVYLHAAASLGLIYNEGVDLHFLPDIHAVGLQYPVAVFVLEESPACTAYDSRAEVARG